MIQYPKLLIISNECLSNSTSNGRTLRNFVQGWPIDKLAQFHVRNVAPDDSICSRYYYVSDNAALKAFVKGKPISRQSNVANSPRQQQQGTEKIGRNAITMMLRNLVWNSMRWADKEFYQWIDAFAPEVILLQAGDCGFMLRLARLLAEKYGLPLVIYNSEAYYFKNHDYFQSTGIAKLFYPVFHRNFCREFNKTIERAAISIYNCDKLKAEYDTFFSFPSEAIYTATQMTACKSVEINKPLRISYLGNLGVGRHDALVEIAEVLQTISPELKLDVYGKIPNQQVEKAFAGCTGINYKGFVAYEEVKDVMHHSDILIHTENFSEFYREDSKYAFSTKIADSLASGKCFLLYAPENMACSEYLIEKNSAYVVGKHADLLPVLRKLCSDPDARIKYIDCAQRLVQENHSAEKNSERFQRIICESIGKEL